MCWNTKAAMDVTRCRSLKWDALLHVPELALSLSVIKVVFPLSGNSDPADPGSAPEAQPQTMHVCHAMCATLQASCGAGGSLLQGMGCIPSIQCSLLPALSQWLMCCTTLNFALMLHHASYKHPQCHAAITQLGCGHVRLRENTAVHCGHTDWDSAA